MSWKALALVAVLATNPAAATPGQPSGGDDAAQEARAAAAEAAQRQLWETIAREGTPRDRALVARLPWPGDSYVAGHTVRTGRLLREAAMQAPADELVQWLWASAPDEWSGCDARHPCPERSMALARLTPDNALAWGPVLDHASAEHDRAALSDALDRMAASSRFQDPFPLVVDAWRDLLQRFPLPPQFTFDTAGRPATDASSLEASRAVMGVAFAAAMVMPLGSLYRHCNAAGPTPPPQSDLQRCRRVAALMRHSNTISSRSMGNGLMHRAGGDYDSGFQRQQMWWISAMAPMEGNAAESMRYFDDLHSTLSEIRAVELLLQRSGLPLTPPAGWVYVSPWAQPDAIKAPARPATP